MIFFSWGGGVEVILVIQSYQAMESLNLLMKLFPQLAVYTLLFSCKAEYLIINFSDVCINSVISVKGV